MKTALFILGLMIPALSMSQSKIHFDDDKLKFDKLPPGDTLYFEYPFTNIGDKELLISKIKVSCSCTWFEYPKYPVLPGGTDTIKVWFDTNKKIGFQSRELIISYNSPYAPTEIKFKGKVDHKALKD